MTEPKAPPVSKLPKRNDTERLNEALAKRKAQDIAKQSYNKIGAAFVATVWTSIPSFVYLPAWFAFCTSLTGAAAVIVAALHADKDREKALNEAELMTAAELEEDNGY